MAVNPQDPADRYRDPVVEAYKKDLDMSLLRQSLRLTPEERLLQLIELQKFAEEVRRAGKAARRKARGS